MKTFVSLSIASLALLAGCHRTEIKEQPVVEHDRVIERPAQPTVVEHHQPVIIEEHH